MTEFALPGLPVDISDYTHFVASRQGLYVAGQQGAALVAPGAWFGLTVRDGALYAFGHTDATDSPSRSGRIVRFALDRDFASEILVTGLENGCHQIDFIGNDLHIVDTYQQRILIRDPDGRQSVAMPVAPVSRTSRQPGYVHINSITARCGTIYLMLHNGAVGPSEILCLDRSYAVTGRFAVSGRGCHNIVVLEDGELLSCGSIEGALVSNRGLNRNLIPGLMTRGLSVGGGLIAVGCSIFGTRKLRGRLPGVVMFLDREYRELGRIIVPGSPTDIRRIDGNDLSLANYD